MKENTMEPGLTESASQIIATELKERLHKEEEGLYQKRESLKRRLATIGMHLTEVERILEDEPMPITATVNISRREYKDDVWIGGFRDSSHYKPIRLNVVSRSFKIICLAAYAKWGGPLPTTPKDVERQNENTSTRDYTMLYISSTDIDSELISSDRHRDILRSHLDEATLQAVGVINELREKVEQNNPYEGIPIKINQQEVIDALLRIEILKYCANNDSSFSVEEVVKA